MKRCRWCQKPFEPKTENQVSCSPGCTGAYWAWKRPVARIRFCVLKVVDKRCKRVYNAGGWQSGATSASPRAEFHAVIAFPDGQQVTTIWCLFLMEMGRFMHNLISIRAVAVAICS